MSEAVNIVKDPTLTYNQELIALAHLGENLDDSIRFSDVAGRIKLLMTFSDKSRTNLCQLIPALLQKR